MVDELNQLMADHPMLFRLKASERAASTEMWFTPRQPEDLCAPLAHSAATLFAHADRNRVRQCGQCVLHFQDTSKKGTRRWCSMQLCGNRLKVAAYATRQRLRNHQNNPYPVWQAVSIAALAPFKVAWVSRAILRFAIRLRSLAFRDAVE